MAISASEVKALRELTGAGMMDCKRALQEAGGDLEKAKDLLRQQGLAKGEKRAGRATGEGCLALATSPDHRAVVALELNCETDFVGRSDDFRGLAAKLAERALANGADSPEAVGAEDDINDAVARIGEVIRLGRVVRYASETGLVASYLHTATHRVAVVIELSVIGEAPAEAIAAVGREVAMQVAAMRPLCAQRADIPAEVLEREKSILRQAADMANKPPQIQEKIIEGRLNKFYSEAVLVDQPYAKDDSLTIAKYLAAEGQKLGVKLDVVRFARLEVGAE